MTPESIGTLIGYSFYILWFTISFLGYRKVVAINNNDPNVSENGIYTFKKMFKASMFVSAAGIIINILRALAG